MSRHWTKVTLESGNEGETVPKVSLAFEERDQSPEGMYSLQQALAAALGDRLTSQQTKERK